MRYTWEYSDNADLWQHDVFENIEDCIKDAKENYDVSPGNIIFIGEIAHFEITVNAGTVLDLVEDDAQEACGEVASDWYTYDYKNDKATLNELSDQLTECVKNWLEEQNNMPTFYHVTQVKKYEVY